jgi:hypothetical protein
MLRRKKKDPYAEFLKSDFGEIVDGLDLEPLQKRFLHSRWLDQLIWFERKAGHNQRRYYTLRLMTIAGGVVVPTIVSLNVRQDSVATGLAWATFAVSLLVALSAALESFFHYGERWRTFRRTSEALKALAWQFFELAGPYAGYGSHKAAFPLFVAQVELLVQQDVETFIAQAAQAQAAPPEAAQEAPAPPRPAATP